MSVAAVGKLVHRGPRAAERRPRVATTLVRVAGTLPAGAVAMDAVAALFAAAGGRGGMLELAGAAFDPFRYVLPAYSNDGVHAAWYSPTHAPEGRVTVERGTATVGWRDGARFLHCHGLWGGSGFRAMGHMLPFDCVLAADVAVAGVGSADAWFDATPDAETNFTLFGPAGGGEGADLLARLRPEEDVTLGIEALCAEAGIAAARVRGIGSIARIRFDGGGTVDCIATEVRIAGGGVEGGRARLAIEAVDVDGRIAEGVLVRGGNPVGVTFELAIERGGAGR